MGLVKPDLTQVQDQVAPGVYKVRVVGSKIDEWQGKDGKPNTPLIVWRMETFGEAEVKNNGRSIFHRTPISGGGAFRFAQFYSAAMKQTFEAGQEFDTEMVHGRELEVTLVDGTDKQGNPTGYQEIKATRPL